MLQLFACGVNFLFYFSRSRSYGFIMVLSEHKDPGKFVLDLMLTVKVIIPFMLLVLSIYQVLESTGTSKVRPEVLITVTVQGKGL